MHLMNYLSELSKFLLEYDLREGVRGFLNGKSLNGESLNRHCAFLIDLAAVDFALRCESAML